MSQLRNALSGSVAEDLSQSDETNSTSYPTEVSQLVYLRFFLKVTRGQVNRQDHVISPSTVKMKTALLAPGTISNYLKLTET